jgi:uncharacterized protein (TIGR03437 family)
VKSVVNAASFNQSGISPGEIVTLTGFGIGPKDPASIVFDGNGRVATILSGTRVLFSGIAAPMIYASATQVSAVVPYEIAGLGQTTLQVEYNSVLSSGIPVLVVDASPGIFTLNASGIGPGAIRNQDTGVNYPVIDAADRGSVISIYATGEGQTDPPGVDGQPAFNALPKPTLPVTAQIGGIPAEVLYAGAAPTIVAGMMQVNVRVPATTPSGPNIPVQISVGNKTSQPGVTMAIKETAAVLVTFSPNPVQQSREGTYVYYVTLQETHGVSVTLTGLTIDGTDRSDLLFSMFLSNRLGAHQSLTGNYSTKCPTTCQSSTWIFSGNDDQGHTGLTWNSTVRFLPPPANVQISFSPNPVHQSADGTWQFAMTLQETTGVGVTFTDATRIVFGVVDDDMGLFALLGSSHISGGGQLSTPPEKASCSPAAYCSLPIDVTYTLFGYDDNGNKNLSWSGTVRQQ